MKKVQVLFLFILLGCIDKKFIETNQINLSFANESGKSISKIELYFKELNTESNITKLVSDTIFISEKINDRSAYTFKYNIKNLEFDRLNIDANRFIVYNVHLENKTLIDSIQFVKGFEKEIIVK